MNQMFAICGTAFFIAFAVISAMVGDEHTARFVILFLFFAGGSQFFAQGGTTTSYVLAMVFVFGSLLSALAVIVTVALVPVI